MRKKYTPSGGGGVGDCGGAAAAYPLPWVNRVVALKRRM
jgi:hypothetical protein